MKLINILMHKNQIKNFLILSRINLQISNNNNTDDNMNCNNIDDNTNDDTNDDTNDNINEDIINEDIINEDITIDSIIDDKYSFNYTLYISLNLNLNFKTEQIAYEHFIKKGRYDVEICRSYYSNIINILIPEELEEWSYMKFLISKQAIRRTFLTYEQLYIYYDNNYLLYPIDDEYLRYKYNIPTNFNIDVYKANWQLGNYSNLYIYKHYVKYINTNNDKHYITLNYVPHDFNFLVYKTIYNIDISNMISKDSINKYIYEYYQKNYLTCPLNNTYYKMLYNIPDDFNSDIYCSVYKLFVFIKDLNNELDKNITLYRHYYYCKDYLSSNIEYYKKLYNIPDNFNIDFYQQYFNIDLSNIQNINEQNKIIYTHYSQNNDKIDETYYKKLYNISDDFSCDIYYQAYKDEFNNIDIDSNKDNKFLNICTHYRENKYKIYSEINEPYYKLLYKLPIFDYNKYLPIYKTIVPLNDKFMDVSMVFKFYKHIINLQYVYDVLINKQSKSTTDIKFIDNYKYIKDLKLSESDKRKFILLKDFARTYYGKKSRLKIIAHNIKDNIKDNIDITDSVVVLNNVLNNDINLYNIFYNMTYINHNFTEYINKNIKQIKPYIEYNNIAILIALDTFIHTLLSLKLTIYTKGTEWAHVILCETKNEKFFKNIINTLKLQNIKIMSPIPPILQISPISPISKDLNEKILDRFKDKNIYVYDSINTIFDEDW